MFAKLERRVVSVKWIKVWIECQILACDDDSRSVAHTVSDYAVVVCYAYKCTGEAAVGWHLCKICSL